MEAGEVRKLFLWRWRLLVLLWALCWGMVTASGASSQSEDGGTIGKKKVKSGIKWRDIDLDALEKEWEEGDADDELMTDDKLQLKKMEERSMNTIPFDPNNPQEFLKKGGGRTSGPVMMFVDLAPQPPAGGTWTKEAIDDLAVLWKEMLSTGGIKTTVFNIDDSKVLVNVQEGENAADVKDFLIEQPETDFATWNSMKYFPPGRTEPLATRAPRAQAAPSSETIKPRQKRKKDKKAARVDVGSEL